MTPASPTHGHQEEGGEDYDDTMESLTEQVGSKSMFNVQAERDCAMCVENYVYL